MTVLAFLSSFGDALEFIARLSYFGDDSVMRLLGYDADAILQ